MIRAGDTIENPVTGERLVFHRTSAETHGDQALTVSASLAFHEATWTTPGIGTSRFCRSH